MMTPPLKILYKLFLPRLLFFVKTHQFGNPPPNLDPPLLSSTQQPITTQPSTSHSPHQFTTPSETAPPPYPISNQPSISHIHQTLPPIPLSFHNAITTQLQSHSSQQHSPPIVFSSNPNPQFSLFTSHNLAINLELSTSNPPPISYDP